ncbi:HIRAN domain-containing protein [Sphingomonas sp.]|uniref:HIRAN domain-containing protein n=1 Tax=Sphingomonas sp. TaxID=28214 RepID=UPI002611B44C|nr:HIRAN domain-containing protein [Sphingomonas sp.]MDF2602991.1 hypothetical protein [Sphingomonas sp.]
MKEFSLAVVGINYLNADQSNRRFELAMCAPGEPVHLVPETNNRHDPAAVAVFSARGVQIGYLSSERCLWIGTRIGAGEEHEAVFQATGQHAAMIRIRFGGGSPTLPAPPPKEAAPEEDEWLNQDPRGDEWLM